MLYLCLTVPVNCKFSIPLFPKQPSRAERRSRSCRVPAGRVLPAGWNTTSAVFRSSPLSAGLLLPGRVLAARWNLPLVAPRSGPNELSERFFRQVPEGVRGSFVLRKKKSHGTCLRPAYTPKLAGQASWKGRVGAMHLTKICKTSSPPMLTEPVNAVFFGD